MNTTGDGITEVLKEWSSGAPGGLAKLMPMVAQELRVLARAHFRREPPGHTLQPTALVSELYLKLTGQLHVRLESRTQFYAFASRLMRRILVDHLRRRRRVKRGCDETRISLDEVDDVPCRTTVDVLVLDDALQALHRLDPRQHQVVELRLFGGLSVEECAALLDVSPATVKRDWVTAKAWLRHTLRT
jgi:RNA polymerase sigma-70 factor, ECF subfamily